MTPLKVYLCDLTHDTVVLVSDTIPVNLGYVGSYAKKIHGKSIDISLFKYPNDAIKSIKKNPPDVLALSNYSWNSLLSEHVCGIAKSKNSEVITVQGGPNFPHTSEQQYEFLKKRPNTDFHIELEGETSFSNLIDRILKYRKGEINLFDSPINGSVFVHPNKKKGLIKGERPPRIKFLNDIPSPYLSGMIDNFFDGRLSPLLETNRGCPFKCTYCHTGNDYFQKIHMFSIERIKKELEYIAVRSNKNKNTVLQLGDSNFGMFPRDRDVCNVLADTQKKYSWPLSIIVGTGKNNKERVIDITSVLGSSFTVAMSVQSMDEKVLKNVKRSNIKLDHYSEISASIKKQGRSSGGEVIVGLPGETKKSFTKGVIQIIDAGVTKLIIYSLLMLYGTEFKDPKYRSDFKMKGKFRIVPLNLGEYDGTKIFDYEEVCIEHKDMPFKDYLDIRQLALVVESIYNNQAFEVFFRYALTIGITPTELILRILNNIDKAPSKIVEIFNEFKRESKEELWNSEKELVNYYKKAENYQKLLNGKAGGNLIYKYKSINLATVMPDWIKFLSTMLEELVLGKKMKNIKTKQHEIFMLSEYHKCRTWKFLDGLSDENQVTMKSDYDFLAWLDEDQPKPLSKYRVKNPIQYYFILTEMQQRERYDQFRRYGTSISALSKIVTRIRLENWFRSVGTDPKNIQSYNFSGKRSRTRYAMST